MYLLGNFQYKNRQSIINEFFLVVWWSTTKQKQINTPGALQIVDGRRPHKETGFWYCIWGYEDIIIL
jgi:hypothetical protein